MAGHASRWNWGEKTLKQQMNFSAKYMLEYEHKGWAVHESFVGRYIVLRVLFKALPLNYLLSFSFIYLFIYSFISLLEKRNKSADLFMFS